MFGPFLLHDLHEKVSLYLLPVSQQVLCVKLRNVFVLCQLMSAGRL